MNKQYQGITQSMPDIAKSKSANQGQLDWVGMHNIEVPILFNSGNGTPSTFPAVINAHVNLTNPEVKGIHMSRLYLLVDRLTEQEVTRPWMEHLLKELLESHKGLSDSARIELSFELMVRRKALKSGFSGWRRYPVHITGKSLKGEVSLEMSVQVVYSSTCPCSAALARQLIQDKFNDDFSGSESIDFDEMHDWLGSEQSILATPHSQRSTADIKVKLSESDKNEDFQILKVIDQVEGVLKTSVQTAVKREDEQEFARLNGQNLMFCEDACRKIKNHLDQDNAYKDFHIFVRHMESLHPHDATSETSKGIKGGY